MYWCVQGYRELRVGFIYCGIILFYFVFYLQNVSFFNFSVLLETAELLKIDEILISQLWYTRWWNNGQMKEFKEHGIA